MSPNRSPDDLVAAMPFAQALGVALVAVDPAEVVAELAWAPERCTAGGAMHGGALMGLADSAGAVCAFLNLPPGAATSTISSSTVFLAGVRSGVVRATARPLHVGRRVVTVRTVLEADGRSVAEVTQAQAVLPREG